MALRRGGGAVLVGALFVILMAGFTTAHRAALECPSCPGVEVILDDPNTPVLDPSQYQPVSPGPSPGALLDICLNVPLYAQCDSAWGGLKTKNCGFTICDQGCALTSAAMVFRYYGSSETPATLNECLRLSACPIYWQIAANDCSNGTTAFVGKYGYSLSLVVQALEDARPAILELTKPGVKPHWVVCHAVKGYGTDPGEFKVCDPAGSLVRTLAYYTNNGYTGNTIVIYRKRQPGVGGERD